MVQHGDWYYLITSRGDYGDCRYRTIWRRSAPRTRAGRAREGTPWSTGATPACAAPAAPTTSRERPAANRLFFHGWVCKGTNLPCYQSYQGGQDYEDVGKRALYAARLLWTKDGPVLSAFVRGRSPRPRDRDTDAATETPTVDARRSPRPLRRRRRRPDTDTDDTHHDTPTHQTRRHVVRPTTPTGTP